MLIDKDILWCIEEHRSKSKHRHMLRKHQGHFPLDKTSAIVREHASSSSLPMPRLKLHSSWQKTAKKLHTHLQNSNRNFRHPIQTHQTSLLVAVAQVPGTSSVRALHLLEKPPAWCPGADPEDPDGVFNCETIFDLLKMKAEVKTVRHLLHQFH